MVYKQYNNYDRNIFWADKLWEFKESHDLTVIGLAHKLNENPQKIECWLAGEQIMGEQGQNWIQKILNKDANKRIKDF